MKVYVFSQIHDAALDELRSRHEVETVDRPNDRPVDSFQDAEVVVLRSGVSLTDEMVRHMPRLKLVVRAGSGIDNVDVGALERRAVGLERIPEPGADAVAELALALTLSLMRRIRAADLSLRDGRWEKASLVGRTLRGKRLGIVGLGNTGSRFAELALALGMEVVGCVRTPSPDRAAAFEGSGVVLCSFEQVLAQADVVSVHVPLTPTTHHLIGADALASMKPGALLLNLGRGGVVDEVALAEALSREGGVAGAALDVHASEGPGVVSPIAHLDSVLLTPHIGSQTEETHLQIGRRVVAAISRLQTVQDSIRHPTGAERRSGERTHTGAPT